MLTYSFHIVWFFFITELISRLQEENKQLRSSLQMLSKKPADSEMVSVKQQTENVSAVSPQPLPSHQIDSGNNSNFPVTPPPSKVQDTLPLLHNAEAKPLTTATTTSSLSTPPSISETETSKTKGRRRKDMFKLKAEVLYEFTAQNEKQLTIKPGDIITVEERGQPGEWWLGELNGKIGNFCQQSLIFSAPQFTLITHIHTPTHNLGLFPENYCRLILPKRVLSLSSQVKPKIRSLQRECGLLKQESSSQPPPPPPPLPVSSPSPEVVPQNDNTTKLSVSTDTITTTTTTTAATTTITTTTSSTSDTPLETTESLSIAPQSSPLIPPSRLVHTTQTRVKGDPHRRPPQRIFKRSTDQTLPTSDSAVTATPPTSTSLSPPSTNLSTQTPNRAVEVQTFKTNVSTEEPPLSDNNTAPREPKEAVTYQSELNPSTVQSSQSPVSSVSSESTPTSSTLRLHLVNLSLNVISFIILCHILYSFCVCV